jgi:ABC-2 type transport system permease protein
MSAFRALLSSESRILLRDRMALFFTVAFPLIFVLIFGFLMGDIGDVSRSTMGVFAAADADRDLLNEAIAAAGSMTIEPFESIDSMSEAVTDRRVDFALSWNGDALLLLYDANRVQENFAFQQVAQGLATDFNLRRQGATPAIAVEAIDVGEVASTGWFNLVLPGILAFSVLSSGLFAISGHLTAMKERRLLDRLIVTPMPPVALLAAIVVVRLIIVYLSTLITLFVGVLVFGLRYDVSWLRYTVFVACATVGTMGIGTIIALVVRRPSSASNIANALAMVMLFLAGIYFPVEFMPGFLRAISKGLPLTHMASAMRYATGVTEMAETEFWAITFSFLGIAILLFPVLARYVVRPLRQ